MKEIIRYSLISVCAVLVAAYLVAGVVLSRQQMPSPDCSRVVVCIRDSAQRSYLQPEEVHRVLRQNMLYPVGKSMNDVETQRIEEQMLKHDLVRTCECYTIQNGRLCVELTQRVPLLRVVTGGETYFIDTDRKMMPVRADVRVSVLLATGDVSRRMAAEQLSDFAEWLRQDAFWRARIARVHVSGPHSIILKQANNNAEILLGDWNDYAQKLNKLRLWYERSEAMEMPTYQQLDVRFKGQVIGVQQALSSR
ncbi:MAG: hypothetical protein MJZ65_03300 [Paludibacteraceae bacterium]|nr:hypothetical protein [Paludibacteraceae bacterium]